MFYSQFILAKKGPLGTIWIAAHLERKLKKNQVADTDISDSVDSILFPDVPIALRLSSHLLLGVVRIYSRKVNYLFHDCSEALLKVKQAFRSTAVDLPPEESTAPYHSITLPETFDLDDFELPDSALLNGNFDDRHVSSREQITLQDTLDGTGYSTSQFGLDERFGDGDASQIGLDLDEELLLDDNLKLQHDSVSYGDAHKGEGASDLTKMDIDETQLGFDEDRTNEASKELSELLCNDRGKHVILDVQNVNRIEDSSHRLVFNIRTPDLNEVFLPDDHIGGPSGAHNREMDFAAADPPSLEFNEFGNFSSTPTPINCQELPASNPQEVLPYTDLLNGKLDKPINQEVECPDATNENLINATSTNPGLDNVSQAIPSPTKILDEPKSDFVSPQCPGGILHSSNPVNDVSLIHNDSKDATNNGKLISIESTDLKVSEVSRVLPSITLALTEALPGCLVSPPSENLINATLTNPGLDNVSQAIPSPTSILDEPKSDFVVPQCSGGILPSSNPVNDISLIHNDSQDATNNGNLLSIESTDLKVSEVSRVLSSSTLALTEAVPDSLVPPRSENLINATSTNPGLDIISQAIPSPTSILDEPKSDFVAPQCSGGILPSSNPVNDISLVPNDSKDATNNGNLISIESTDLKASEVSRVLPSSSLALTEAVPDSLVPPRSDGTVDTPMLVGSESTVRTTDTSHAGTFWNETNDLPLSMGNGIPYEDTTRLSNLDQRPVQEANSYQTNIFSFLSSDFHMRSCTSVSNQANLTSPGGMLLEKTPEFSSRNQPCNLETPMVHQELHFSGSYLVPQGFPSVAIDTNLGLHQKSNDIQLGHLNCFSRSEFSEPERMLFAPSRNVNLLSDLGQQTIEKGVIESDRSVDCISNLHGQKRRLLDNTPESQNNISPNMYGIPQKKQNNDYIIPKDDDLLASILVGRRTPALKMGPTPPLPKPPPSKRPRLAQKVGLPKKRKVLLDDTIVLHADAIRQQLMNTEDIRRMRRKAPCTRPEIWRIQKRFIEENIFCESIFIGISDELNSLLSRKYDPEQNMHAQAHGHHSSGESIKEFELSKSSPLVRDNDGREIAVQAAVVKERVDGEIQGTSGISDELNSLLTRRYDPVQNMHAQAYGHHSSGEAIKEFELSKSSPLVRDNDGRERAVQAAVVIERVDGEIQGTSGISDELNGLLTRRNDPVQNMHAQAYGHHSSGEATKEFELSKSSPLVRDTVGREIAVQAAVVTERVDGEIHGTSGLSDELNSLLTRRYDPVQNMHSQAYGHHSSGEAIKEFELSKSSPSVRDNDGREIAVQAAVVIEKVDGELQGTSGGELVDAESCQIAVSIDAQQQLESPFEVPFDSKIEENHSNILADAEHSSLNKEFHTSHEIAKANDNALHAADIVLFEKFTSVDCVAVNDGPSVQVEDLFNAKAVSITVEDMGVDMVKITNLDCPQDEQAGITKVHCDGPSASMLDRFVVEVGADVPEDSTVIEHANSSVPGMGLVCRDDVLDGEKAASEVTCGERPNLVSFTVPPGTEVECVPSAVSEKSSLNAEGGLEVGSTPMELAVTRESSEFCRAINDVDTDFLNVDDDAKCDEEMIFDAPNTEGAQSLQNSGWSSRTRGVARYLKALFDQESGRARKSVAVDHLLAGKTQKEASRMFFETLVLKTRDYIHVEQDNPFGCINIKPRIKLLKTEF